MKYKLFYISILCYSLSMFLPVSELEWGFIGFQAFIMIILAIGESELLFMIPWLANFTYLTNLLLRNKKRSIRITVSIFTVVFSLFAFGSFKFPFQEAGIFDLYIGPGFLLWMLSFILMLISEIKEYKKAPKH